jgi:hypothetical protein
MNKAQSPTCGSTAWARHVTLLFLLLGGFSSIQGMQAAPAREISGIEIHVAWLAQPAPEVLPSGVVKVSGWRHLFYDDTEDDRLDGYVVVEINAHFDADGKLVQGYGTFTVREKLDDIAVEEFIAGTHDPSQVVMGEILWEGVWNVTPNQPGFRAVAMNDEGAKAFYRVVGRLSPTVVETRIRLLEPGVE